MYMGSRGVQTGKFIPKYDLQNDLCPTDFGLDLQPAQQKY